VALDRGAKMAERFKLPGDASKWRAAAEEIRAAILDEAWDEKLNMAGMTPQPHSCKTATNYECLVGVTYRPQVMRDFTHS
jgi:GH15 family glucan-1,4-alpha-glucosidase